MRSHAVSVIAIAVALIGLPAEAVQRAYVASFGSDANAATSCGFAAPCRSFAAAVPVVDSGGEVLALDSVGYGVVTIDKSIALTAAPGAYAGISVSAGGTGVTIATPGVNVTLRGLNINNVGGSFGVTMTHGARLSIENCVISNFSNPGGYAVFVNTAAKVRIVDSLIRDNWEGLVLQGGATGDIYNSKFLGNVNAGIFAKGVTASTITSAAVTDSVVTGSNYGIFSYSTHATGKARVSVIRTAATGNAAALLSQSDAGGTVQLAVSDSMVTGNMTGLYQFGAGSVLESLGNNTVRQNTFNVSGSSTLTTVPPL